MMCKTLNSPPSIHGGQLQNHILTQFASTVLANLCSWTPEIRAADVVKSAFRKKRSGVSACIYSVHPEEHIQQHSCPGWLALMLIQLQAAAEAGTVLHQWLMGSASLKTFSFLLLLIIFFFLNLTFTMQCKCVGMLRSNLYFEEVSESIKTCGWPGGDGLKFVIFWHVYLTKVTLSCPCLYTFSESAGIKVSISDYS